MNRNHVVIVQRWEVSYSEWGTEPAGFSLHLTNADREAYIGEYWDGPEAVPDTPYLQPNGKPHKAEVDAETFAEVKASKNGIRGFGHPPGPGVTGGWVLAG